MAKRITKISIAVVLLIVLCSGILFLLFTNCGRDLNPYCIERLGGHKYDNDGICTRCGAEKLDGINPDEGPDTENPDDSDDPEAEYFQIEADSSSDKLIKLSYIDRKSYDSMGISSAVETAYTLTATLSPADADNQNVVWSVEFVNPDSEWATGKDPEDYVNILPTTYGSNRATVTCLQAFSEPINVIAQSEDNEEATASCLCDYVKRVVGVDLQISTETMLFGTTYTVEATPRYGVGTLEGNYIVSGYTLELVSEIRFALNALTAEGTFASDTAHAYYVANKNAAIESNVSEGTFSFNGKDAYEVFGTGHCDSSSVEKAKTKAISALRTLVNNTFKEKVTEISGSHMTFTFNFTYTYEGKSYVETTATAELKFDVETLAIHVVSISLDNDHVVF